MHLVIYFCGTGDTGSFGDGEDYDYLFNNSRDEPYANPKIKALFVKGCHDSEVCNEQIFPDLVGFAKRFVSELFNCEDNELTVDASSKKDLLDKKVGLISEILPDDNKFASITGITLCGYSRGAVTCFNVARELNELAPNIPVNIVADNPVPGNAYAGPGTNAGSVSDCSDLANLRNVSIILGSYTGFRQQNGDTDYIHRGFFSQIVPKLPRRADLKREIIVVPRQHHNEFPANVPSHTHHLHMQVAKILFDNHLIQEDEVIRKKQTVKELSYNRFEYSRTPNFPRIDKLQPFFGITHRELYRHKDRLHPTYYLSEGYEFVENELMIDWWNRHDKESSYFMSDLTKSLIESIQSINNTQQTLIDLFKRVDQWLVVKADTKSSRYALIESLRNNIYHQLVTTHGVKADELSQMSRSIGHESKYFLNHWQSLSASASFWKTEATERLDATFEAHAGCDLSRKNDQILLTALNQWIQEKQGSDSKRWDIVLEMKEILEEAIKLYDPNLEGKDPEAILIS